MIGMLAFARYYADLPNALPSPHAGAWCSRALTTGTATTASAPSTTAVNKQKIAFAFTIEHLGAREILPTGEGSDRHLEFTGKADPALVRRGR